MKILFGNPIFSVRINLTKHNEFFTRAYHFAVPTPNIIQFTPYNNHFKHFSHKILDLLYVSTAIN